MVDRAELGRAGAGAEAGAGTETGRGRCLGEVATHLEALGNELSRKTTEKVRVAPH